MKFQNFKQLEFEEKEITYQLNKSKLLYAISIVDKLISSKDSKKINNDLHLVWKISGFKSKKMFENSFKLYKGISLYDYCEKLSRNGVTILRPPRDGRMAFIRSPDQISIELLQNGESLPIKEPWASMKNQGKW